LKHIERVSVLFHCISCETDDLIKRYQTIRDELKEFNPKLIDKQEIILLTKTDLKIRKRDKSLPQCFEENKKANFAYIY